MKLNAGKDSKFTVADPCQGEPCKTGQKYHKLLKTRLSQLRHYISWTPVPNFLIFCPYTSVLLCGTLLVLGTLAIARALSSCLLLLPYLSHRKPTLCASMLSLLRPNADNICRNLGLSVECGKKYWTGEVQLIPVAKHFVDLQKWQRTTWEMRGK